MQQTTAAAKPPPPTTTATTAATETVASDLLPESFVKASSSSSWLQEQLEIASRAVVFPDDECDDVDARRKEQLDDGGWGGTSSEFVFLPEMTATRFPPSHRFEEGNKDDDGEDATVGGRFALVRLSLLSDDQQQPGRQKRLRRYLFGGVDVSFPLTSPKSTRTKPSSSSTTATSCAIDDIATTTSEEQTTTQQQQEEAAGAAAVAVYVVLDGSTLEVAYEDHLFFVPRVPYVPSFLAFREVQPMLQLLKRQRSNRPELTPDVVLVDGNGALHPRNAGIATHVGVLADLPTIGVAKNLYCHGGLSKRLVSRGVNDALADAAGFAVSLVTTAAASSTAAAASGSDEVTLTAATATAANTTTVLFDSRPICDRDNPERQQQQDDDDDDEDAAAETAAAGSRDRRRNTGELLRRLVDAVAATTSTAIPVGGKKMATMPFALDGMAVPLACRCRSSSKGGGDDRYRTLACALIGHGGKLRGTGKKNKKKNVGATKQRLQQRHVGAIGTSVPVYVSVGHKTSLRAAVAACAALSVTRIPEPIRQADLIGRDLQRQRQRRTVQQHVS